MIIHRLEFRAFMAYPGRESIRFEGLNEAGIFLLNGPTGAGKTTVLDAICYAIYGKVSSGRSESELRSHFAAPGVAPFVELELTVQNQRLHIHRSPAWMRPKKRGTGMVQEKATHRVTRLVAGSDPARPDSWEEVGNRHAESAQYVQSLIGLTREQFLKVMLLPQGEFAQLLRTVGRERQELLKKLFPVQTYERIVESLEQQAKDAQQQAASASTTLTALRDEGVKMVRELKELLPHDSAENPEAAHRETVTEIQEGEQLPVSEVPGWMRQQLEPLRANEEREQAQLEKAKEQLTEYRDELSQLRTLRENWAEYERLRAASQQLGAREEYYRADKTALEKSRAASPIHALFQRAEKDERQAEALAAEAARVRTDTEKFAADKLKLLGQGATEHIEEPVYCHRLDAAGESLDDLLGEATATLREYERVEQELATVREGEKKAREELTELENSLKELQGSLAATDERLERTEKELEGHRDIEVILHRDSTAAEEAEKDVAAAREYAVQCEESRRSVQRAESDYAAEHRWAQQARKKLDTLNELRFRQAAAHLAHNLREGEACAVCGSTTHPNPAIFRDGEEKPVEQSHIREAEKEAQAAGEAETAAHGVLTEARTVLKRLEDASTATVEQAKELLDKARQQLSATLEKADAAHQARTLRDELHDRQQTLTEERAELLQQRSAAHTRVEAATARVSELAQSRTEASAGMSVSERLSALTEYGRLVRAVRSAIGDASRAAQVADSSAAQARQGVEDSPFADAVEVRAAVLTNEEEKTISERVREHEEEKTRLEAGLARQPMRDIAAEYARSASAPDESAHIGLERSITDLEHTRDRLLLRRTRYRDGAERITRFIADFTAKLERSRQAIARDELYGELAAVARAKAGSNNIRKIDLVNYVLAGEFNAVVGAAAAHLEQMSSGRFSLVYSQEQEGKERTGLGLGVKVMDNWQGTERRTASLSGGETFMASLALALGLAEIVQENNGGIEINTLFIDEGFGTLDGETLEQVMATIDGLRRSGRTISLISHVEELKNRIPTQIMVDKGQSGSTLRVNF